MLEASLDFHYILNLLWCFTSLFSWNVWEDPFLLNKFGFPWQMSIVLICLLVVFNVFWLLLWKLVVHQEYFILRLFQWLLFWLTDLSLLHPVLVVFWWLILPTDCHAVFLWCLRGFCKDVLKAGFWVCFSPPFSSLTGTRKSKLGQNRQDLGEAEAGPPPQLTLTLVNVRSLKNPGMFSFKSEPSWLY